MTFDMDMDLLLSSCPLAGWTPIHGLLFSCGPSAIGAVIALIIIYSVQRKAFRLFTHIFQKFRKTISPLFTYSDSSPTIIFKSFIEFIQAPGFHSRPYDISRMRISPRRISVFHVPISRVFSTKASTTTCVSRLEVATGCNKYISTTAKAFPVSVFTFGGVIPTLYRKSSEYFTQGIEWLSHKQRIVYGGGYVNV